MLFTRYKQHRLNESPCVGSVFKADAVNEEDSERDRATQEEEEESGRAARRRRKVGGGSLQWRGFILARKVWMTVAALERVHVSGPRACGWCCGC